MVFLELLVELLYLLLLCESCTAGEYGLLFFITSEGSPESHDCISLVLIDESFIMHDDIGNFFEIDTQKMHEFLWLHILGYTGESGDIREETGDVHPLSIELHFLEFVENIYYELLREILGKGSLQGTFSFFFTEVLVESRTYRDTEDYNEELGRKVK